MYVHGHLCTWRVFAKIVANTQNFCKCNSMCVTTDTYVATLCIQVIIHNSNIHYSNMQQYTLIDSEAGTDLGNIALVGNADCSIGILYC